MEVPFSKLPQDSKIWTYTTSRELTDDEINKLRSYSSYFLEKWTSHGMEIEASVLFPYNHFIIICAKQVNKSLSGCSIDDSIRFIKKIEDRFDLILLDRNIIAFKDGSRIKKIDLENFKKEIARGHINSNTIVFNTLINTKEEYETEWEVSASKSWHSNFLKL